MLKIQNLPVFAPHALDHLMKLLPFNKIRKKILIQKIEANIESNGSFWPYRGYSL